MTITLQTVNELIASLESAGELSIREQKFLKLAKEFRICSASLDAAIKAGNMLADQNAQLAAENVAMRETIEAVRGVADNSSGIAGWHLNGEIAQWSEILPEIDDIETPATDRIVAGIKADAIDEAAVELDRVDTVASTRVIGFKLREFAKQLREGAK
ncbi:hypothetical protein ACJWUX_06180 [Klebsiella pneumoniae]